MIGFLRWRHLIRPVFSEDVEDDVAELTGDCTNSGKVMLSSGFRRLIVVGAVKQRFPLGVDDGCFMVVLVDVDSAVKQKEPSHVQIDAQTGFPSDSYGNTTSLDMQRTACTNKHFAIQFIRALP